jgi:hypothetical protein
MRPKVTGLAEGRSEVETFETLEIFQVREERESSGGGVTTTVRSTAKEEIWTIQSTSRHQKKSRVGGNRSQPLDLGVCGPTVVGSR